MPPLACAATFDVAAGDYQIITAVRSCQHVRDHGRIPLQVGVDAGERLSGRVLESTDSVQSGDMIQKGE